MKYLLLGSTGMLGKAFKKIAVHEGHEVLGVARSGADVNLDVTDDALLLNLIKSNEPDVLINTVSITDLNYCEKNPHIAYLVNSRPSSIISNYCRKNEIFNVYISTDHYYTGDQRLKHDESSPVVLINEYARTKYIAEKFIETNPDSLTLRTNIVGFREMPEKPTFVEWIINAFKDDKKITAFNDYYTSSIDVISFSEIMLKLIEKRINGLYNLGSCEVSSKMEFINKMAEYFEYDLSRIIAGSIWDIDGPKRAESLGLDVSKIETKLGHKMPGLDTVISTLHNEYIGENCEI